jgi:hypothetical protein
MLTIDFLPNKLIPVNKEKVLIVTDGAESIRKMADKIAESLENCTVTAVNAEDFSGTQLLPAALCFFGSESSKPPSFKYLDTVLRHINLAGRRCGIFSNSNDAAEYLKEMVHDSEITLYPDVLMEGKGDVKKWTKNVAKQLKKATGEKYGVKT